MLATAAGARSSTGCSAARTPPLFAAARSREDVVARIADV